VDTVSHRATDFRGSTPEAEADQRRSGFPYCGAGAGGGGCAGDDHAGRAVCAAELGRPPNPTFDQLNFYGATLIAIDSSFSLFV